MRYTRKFLFEPSWESRSMGRPNANDLYEIPPFNKIAMFLNYKGWKIDSFRYIDDTYPHFHSDRMKLLELYCSREGLMGEEPAYEYISIGECELSYYDKKAMKRKEIRI